MPGVQNTISVKITADAAQAMQAIHGLEGGLTKLTGKAMAPLPLPAMPNMGLGMGRRGGVIDLSGVKASTSAMRDAGNAARGGALSMQRMAGAALMLSNTTGPAAGAIRGLASVLLMTGGNAKQLWATLRGGGAMAAALLLMRPAAMLKPESVTPRLRALARMSSLSPSGPAACICL
jgi:hypothetical protein